MKAADRARERWFERGDRLPGFNLFCEMPKEAGNIINMVVVDDTLFVLAENGLWSVDATGKIVEKVELTL